MYPKGQVLTALGIFRHRQTILVTVHLQLLGETFAELGADTIELLRLGRMLED